jgi:hypothetical protein
VSGQCPRNNHAFWGAAQAGGKEPGLRAAVAAPIKQEAAEKNPGSAWPVPRQLIEAALKFNTMGLASRLKCAFLYLSTTRT